jgi:hypothetical protein
MRTQGHQRTRRFVVALIACGLLLGCGNTESGRERAASGMESAKAASTVAPPRDPTPAPTAPLVAGDPWTKAAEYLGTLQFVGGASEDLETANVCGTMCPARLHLRPERRALDLEPGDFAASQRVIAEFELDEDAPVPPLGFDPGVRGARSWLLTTGPTTAVVMYESAGKIAFTRTWRFETTSDLGVAHQQKARWLNSPHMHGPGRPDTVVVITHLQSAWVSCAEGCCNATSLE